MLPISPLTLLCAGGKQELKPGNMFYDAMVLLTDWAMEDYDSNGEIFPIHYTCLGLEAIVVKVDGDDSSMSAALLICAHERIYTSACRA